MRKSFVRGTYEGTGAAANISCGFQPDFVMFFNAEDGDVAGMWSTKVDSGSFDDTKGIGISDDGSIHVAGIGSAGVSAYSGSSSAGEGFSLGTDATLNESGKDFTYWGFRSGDGRSGPVISSYTGTGVAQNVEVGFVPYLLIVVDVTDGTNIVLWSEENSGFMADGKDINIVDDAVVGNAANGITGYDGADASSGPGFTVGTDSEVNENAKTFVYIAFREDDLAFDGPVVGTFDVAGTPAAQNVQLGFQPSAVIITNAEDGDVVVFWSDTSQTYFDAGLGIVLDANIAGISSDGVTAYAGSSATYSEGFTVGVDGSIGEANKTYVYAAWR